MSDGAKEISRREIQIKSLLIMIGVVVGVLSVAFVQIYRISLERTEVELQELVGAQATLMEAVARYDAIHSGPDGGSRARTIAQFREASLRFREFGKTGELVLAEQRDGQLHFLLPERSIGYEIPAPIPLGADSSVQLQRALRGESGVGRGNDFRGKEVVGAYQYLPFLDAALVAKVDVAEIRAPFVRVLLVTTGVALLLLAIGLRLHAVVVGPLLALVFRKTRTLETGLRSMGAESERYATVFRSAADPIIIEGPDGRILEANRAAAEAYGWSQRELEGKSIYDLLAPEIHAFGRETRAQCFAGEEIRDINGVRITRDGTRRNVIVGLSPLRDEHGQVVALASITKDVTDITRAQERLEEYSRSLEQTVAERTKELEHELRVARALAEEMRRGHEIALIGDSLEVRTLREQIERHAAELEPLLLGGPAGSGQESVARAIHDRSPRASKAFIVIDCSRPVGDDSTPLLGLRHDPGKVAVAEGGTLYLDLVDQLAMSLQEELALMLAQAHEMRAKGLAPRPDIRVIAFLAPDMFGAVNAGKLHPALASQLGRNRLAVPSLAERRADLEPIALRILLERARSLGRPAKEFSPRAIQKLRDYEWPGNLRELQNVVERVLLASVGTTVEIDEDLRQASRSIGGYRLIKRIGRGGMGEVWLGEHALLKRPAAIKLTQRSSDTTPDERDMLEKRFRREAEVTARLRSPHTVELYDFGVTPDGQFYYVMEFLEGLSLSALIERERALPAERAIHLARQACLSLAEAHAAGLVHRDIKPENLFVCRLVSEVDFVKVLDFGIVKQSADRGGAATQTGMIVGTPAYLSPELAAGREATSSSDIYALGCVLFRMLTGRTVFTAENMMGMVMAHVEEVPVAPSSLARLPVPAELDALVLRCLAKAPEDRPSSAMELRRLLDAIPVQEVWTEVRAHAWWAVAGADTMPTMDLSKDLSTFLMRVR